MFVIWKRPDGFHGATPNDFKVVEVEGEARIWLHHADKLNFPFRISGGWQESEATQRLNNLVNLVGAPSEEWVTHLVKIYNNSMSDKPIAFFTEKMKWLNEVKTHLKGDTWEVEIMAKVLAEVMQKVESVRDVFLKRTSS